MEDVKKGANGLSFANLRPLEKKTLLRFSFSVTNPEFNHTGCGCCYTPIRIDSLAFNCRQCSVWLHDTCYYKSAVMFGKCPKCMNAWFRRITRATKTKYEMIDIKVVPYDTRCGLSVMLTELWYNQMKQQFRMWLALTKGEVDGINFVDHPNLDILEAIQVFIRKYTTQCKYASYQIAEAIWFDMKDEFLREYSNKILE